MDIKEVSVEVGETRNHPFEYGNYRASVRLTAQLEEGDRSAMVTDILRNEARMHVLDECDSWEQRVKEEKRVADLESHIDSCLRRLEQSADEECIEVCRERTEAYIDELPEDLQEEWTDKLEAAYQEAIQYVEQLEKEREEGYREPPEDW